MATIHVQFSDAAEDSIISSFPCPQNPEAFPNQGAVDSSDARWKTYFDALPASAQQFLPPPA